MPRLICSSKAEVRSGWVGIPVRLLGLFLLSGLVLLHPLASGNLHAQERAGQTARARSAVAFTPQDEKIIRDYFAQYPGEAGLPPGESTQIPAAGQRLPSSMPSRALPRDLAIRLKAAPRGYERVIVGNNVLIVATRSGTVADIIQNAW